MNVIYVAGALIADDHYKIRLNIDRAAAVGLEVAKLGASPLIPHTNTGAWFIGTLTHEFWYEATLELLRRCDAMILVPGWEDSKGTKDEKAWAKAHGRPVFETVEELKAWLAIPTEAVEHSSCVCVPKLANCPDCRTGAFAYR